MTNRLLVLKGTAFLVLIGRIMVEYNYTSLGKTNALTYLSRKISNKRLKLCDCYVENSMTKC